MKQILIVDPVCPKSYTHETCLTTPSGGTEATCGRLAKGLADRGYTVTVLQRKREEASVYCSLKGALYYLPLEAIDGVNTPDVVITLRDAGFYNKHVERFPTAKNYLWMHDIAEGDYLSHLVHHLKDMKPKLISVSSYHKRNILEALYPYININDILVFTQYPSLAEYCTRTIDRSYDPKKLVFFSSPHKGLDYVLQIFSKIWNIDNSFKLYIANPGYFESISRTLPDGVVNLGALSHPEVVEHVRGALCTFYPQISFPETFGLVMAESMAVGTPILAHPLGASPEVVEHPNCLMDCTQVDKVVERVLNWSNGKRPIVNENRLFHLNSVLSSWIRLF